MLAASSNAMKTGSREATQSDDPLRAMLTGSLHHALLGEMVLTTTQCWITIAARRGALHATKWTACKKMQVLDATPVECEWSGASC
jgi:hypothetical protein